MIILAFFLGHWYLSLFCQTFFLHRYAAHAMFHMNRAWEKVFFVMSWIFQGSSYLSPYAYGVLHRLHHAHTDTPEDPHSPSYDDNLFKMMWRTKEVYSDIYHDKMKVDEKFVKGVPKWQAFDEFATNWAVRLMWGVAYFALYWVFATEWWMFLLLPIHFVMGPVHGAIINWFAHKYGYVNFKAMDTSKNLMPVDIFMMGEGYHNNHHYYSSRANFGVKWHEFDPTYPVILLLDKLNIIQLKKAKA